MKKLYFVTGNKNKVDEAKRILDFPIEIADIELDEIQSLDVKKVVQKKAEAAFKILKKPLFVDDVSAEFKAWNGFPGPLIKFLAEAGNHKHELTLSMLKGQDNSLTIRAVIGYHDGKEIHIIEGSFEGKIVERRGDGGWGFDPYIIPDGYDMTFGEMEEDLKNSISHRARALANFKKFLDSQKKQKKI